jgi:putative transposase
MPYYRRALVPGGTYFFTLVTENRAPLFEEAAARRILRGAIAECRVRHPFDLRAIVLLPDHLHLMLALPSDDADFSSRIALIKARFTHEFLAAGGTEQPRSDARHRKRRRGVWQRWFWEHAIRDQDDYNSHLNYIHYNPVKHGLVSCPHDWRYSSFHTHVRQGVYEQSWQCVCDGQVVKPPSFGQMRMGDIEGNGGGFGGG